MLRGIFAELLLFVGLFGSRLMMDLHEFDDWGLVGLVVFGDDFVGWHDCTHGQQNFLFRRKLGVLVNSVCHCFLPYYSFL